MIEAVEHIFQIEQAIAANRTGDKSSTSDADGGEPRSSSASSSFFPQRQRATPDRDGLLKYVVLYVLTLVLQPLLAVVLSLAALWGLWRVVLWLFLS